MACKGAWSGIVWAADQRSFCKSSYDAEWPNSSVSAVKFMGCFKPKYLEVKSKTCTTTSIQAHAYSLPPDCLLIAC